jgi:ADP-heptose:LPS heptosyltransferase
VFLLGPQEAGWADRIRAAVPEALMPELGRTDDFPNVRGPLLAIALAGRLTGAVANDAGPGHMLAAGGAPLLSLQQHRRKVAKFRPAARRLEMLVAEDYGSASMDSIPVDAADERLEALLTAP